MLAVSQFSSFSSASPEHGQILWTTGSLPHVLPLGFCDLSSSTTDCSSRSECLPMSPMEAHRLHRWPARSLLVPPMALIGRPITFLLTEVYRAWCTGCKGGSPWVMPARC